MVTYIPGFLTGTSASLRSSSSAASGATVSSFMRAALLTMPISTPEPTPCPETSAM